MAENNTMKNKQRLLRLLRYLYENTDEDHPVKTPELVELYRGLKMPYSITDTPERRTDLIERHILPYLWF